MNVRLENIQTETLPSYVSFLNKPRRTTTATDGDSIHSVSSVRSVLSNVSVALSSGWSSSKDKSSERARAALEADMKYLYSAFTKIPCLRLAPDGHARLIRGYEEFPFDTAVPLHVFKNLGALEVVDMDFRAFFGWDRLSEQLRSLTIKRSTIDDPAELLRGIVLDDMDKRRRRSTTKAQSAPRGSTTSSPNTPPRRSESVPGSPTGNSTPTVFDDATSSSKAAAAPSLPPPIMRTRSESSRAVLYTTSSSPNIPASSARQSQHHHRRGVIVVPPHSRRTSSGSSYSSENNNNNNNNSSSSSSSSSNPGRRASCPYLLAGDYLPSSKWRFLKHLGLPENSLTDISADSLLPVADSLQSIDLSSNLFNQVPDSLASLVSLRAVNLSNCMIESLHSLTRNPLPAIAALNLRGNRIRSLAGIERLPSLERLDLRDNALTDPHELARLTSLPEIREVWVSGNPFVKTHSGYRVVVFNLFRRSPGYSEDILMDGTGPGYAERKQLVDRVAEPHPVARKVVPADTTSAAVVVSKPVRTTTTAATTTSASAKPKVANVPPPISRQRPSSSGRRQQQQQGQTRTNHSTLLRDPFAKSSSSSQPKRVSWSVDTVSDLSTSPRSRAPAPINNVVHNGGGEVSMEAEQQHRYKLSMLKQKTGWLMTDHHHSWELMSQTTNCLAAGGGQSAMPILSAGTS